MLAERVLTPILRTLSGRFLTLDHFGGATLPEPSPGHRYLLYAHVPFCQQLCPYCSFNRFLFSEELAVPYFRRLREEMRRVADLGYDFQSMYVGGGTPTIMLDELCATIDLARELFSIREVSSETNPNHLLPGYVDELAARVQRFSVGVQSFDDSLLKQMDRYDRYGSGAEIIERLQSIAGRFQSLNVDMIFNFPSQTSEMLRRDVRLLEDSGCSQTTFYPLMASPAVGRQMASTVGRVHYAREASLYEQISRYLTSHGVFEHATAWTFSRTSGKMIDEYIVDYDEYLGIGSGAFSYLDGTLYANTFSLRDYDRMMAEGRTPVSAFRRFDLRERMRYRMLMQLFGLRLDKRDFERDFGVTVDRGLAREMAFLRVARAFERDEDEALTLSPKGRYLLVVMMREFFVGVNHFRDQARAALTQEERELLFGGGDRPSIESGAALPVTGLLP